MRSARNLRRSDPRAPSTTFALRSARSSAVASPIPLLAPVIAITLPSIPDITFLLVQFPHSGRRLHRTDETLNTQAFALERRTSRAARQQVRILRIDRISATDYECATH